MTGAGVAKQHPRATEADRLSVLVSLGRAIAVPGSLDNLCWTLYQEIERVIEAPIFIVALYHEESRTVEVVKQIFAGVERPGGSFPLGQGLSSQVIRAGRPHLVRRWSESEPRAQVRYADTERAHPESGIAAPLELGRRVTGLLWLQSYQPETYDEADLVFLHAVAIQAALAIENLRHTQRHEDQLQARIGELEAILSGMTDALIVVDPEGRLIWLNHAARELLCRDNQSIVLGQHLELDQPDHWPLGSRDLAAALIQMLQACHQGQAIEDLEVTLPNRRIFSFSGAPLTGPTGATTSGVILFRDVTDRREAERLKDEVLSIASHDLKNPLNVIGAQLYLLERRLKVGQLTPEDGAKRIEAIRQQTRLMVELLDLLLDLSRIEAGRLQITVGPTDLAQIARDLAEAVQSTTSLHAIRLISPPTVEGVWDETRLRQLLQNLLTNAVKYSPEGGRIEIQIAVDDQWVTTRVRDQGVGIAPADLPYLFERFYRAEGTRKLQGSGLGLYICQGIVTAHGGRIWAESTGLGGGTTLAFTLPRRAGGAAGV